MRTHLSSSNPFNYDRYGYAFENLSEGSKCLDYGCYDGMFLHQCKERKTLEYMGIDKNKDIVLQNPYNEKITFFEDNIPFANNEFDNVTILDVLEHIHDQDKVLREIHRVLKKEGVLIITTPQKNLFSFLDAGNFKFLFPTLHKYCYVLNHSKEEYEYRYLNNQNGLIGDVEKEKKWHQHFTKIELENLLKNNGFTVIEFDGSCLFQRVFILFDLLKVGKIIPYFIRLKDAKMFETSNLFCKAVRR
ncbi:class I SAM-dependent methyltransferase [Sulfuricurvum sp.]|uniref:class I SAM-dependent methyltransferase n=1 Tax=Sulfuricurvum sp. TaxID=2025608 RepID=UPI002615A647|nr:class I SAM-dependent methyltransferase [Sulfuricurvum sp.]MDD2780903.1 class I SAM-dependent methyltransferase [Sulfuricurvum sp.]